MREWEKRERKLGIGFESLEEEGELKEKNGRTRHVRRRHLGTKGKYVEDANVKGKSQNQKGLIFYEKTWKVLDELES